MSEVQRWETVCGDTIYITEGDRTNPAKQQVVAVRSRSPLKLRQKAAGIPVAYRGALLSTWDDARSNPGARGLVETYLADPHRSLYVNGSVGTGKTFTACAIANELLRRGRAVRFCAVSELLLTIRDSFNGASESELEILSPLLAVPHLLLDELGDLKFIGDRRASDFQSSRILALLDRRWRDGRPTIITSNLSLAELVRWTGDERIGSRIAGMCGRDGIVELGGRDLRFDETPAAVGTSQGISA